MAFNIQDMPDGMRKLRGCIQSNKITTKRWVRSLYGCSRILRWKSVPPGVFRLPVGSIGSRIAA